MILRALIVRALILKALIVRELILRALILRALILRALILRGLILRGLCVWLLAPASLYLCVLSRSDSCCFSAVSVPGLLGPFPVILKEGKAIWALASAVYIVWNFRNVTPSLAKCSKSPLAGHLGSFWEGSGEDLGRICGRFGEDLGWI